MSPYETITGRRIEVERLGARERRALKALLAEYERAPAWDAFSARWQESVMPLLAKVPRSERTKHPLYVVAQDLEMRLGIAQGQVAPPDYRDYVADRIAEKFGSRYKFCKATGIPQAFVSQVLSGRKDFSLAMLRRVADALDLSLALVSAEDLAAAPRTDAGALAQACAQVASELATLKTQHDHLRRFRDPKRRREAVSRERELFKRVLDRLEEDLRELDDEAFGARILPAIAQEVERLEALLGGLREQMAKVADSGSLASPQRGDRVDRALSRV